MSKQAKFKVDDQVRDKESGQIMDIVKIHKSKDIDTGEMTFLGRYTCSFVKYGDEKNTIGDYREDELEELDNE